MHVEWILVIVDFWCLVIWSLYSESMLAICLCIQIFGLDNNLETRCRHLACDLELTVCSLLDHGCR